MQEPVENDFQLGYGREKTGDILCQRKPWRRNICPGTTCRPAHQRGSAEPVACDHTGVALRRRGVTVTPCVGRSVDGRALLDAARVHRHRVHHLQGRLGCVGARRATANHQALSARRARLDRLHAGPAHVRGAPDGTRRDGDRSAMHNRPDSPQTATVDRADHRRLRCR